MDKREQLEVQCLGQLCNVLLFADGFDEAIIGAALDMPGTGSWRVVYSRDKCIEILAEQMEAGEGESPWMLSEEFFDFNTEGAYVGQHTPMFVEEEFEERLDMLEKSETPRVLKRMDEAIIGILYDRWGTRGCRLVYDKEKLTKRARAWARSMTGDNVPVIMEVLHVS